MEIMLSSIEAHYYEEHVTNEEPAEPFVIEPDELAKIDKKATAKEASRELAFLYAEGMAKRVDEELKSFKLVENRLDFFFDMSRADKGKPEFPDLLREGEELMKTTKESYSELIIGAIDWAAKSPGFYTGMQMTVSKAAMEMGREDINPCRIDTKDVEDATILFSKRVLEHGLKYGVTMPGHLENNIRKNVAAIKTAVDRESCASYG